MLKDFVHSARHLQHVRLHDHVDRAAREAWLLEHSPGRGLRSALGEKLIRIGERLIESPNSELGQSKKAA